MNEVLDTNFVGTSARDGSEKLRFARALVESEPEVRWDVRLTDL
jgi:hypothetical protein